MAQIRTIVPVAVLTGLCTLVVRQGHELKNEAYRTNELLNEIGKFGRRRVNAVTACNRVASPVKLVRRARSLQLALVHPVEPIAPAIQRDGARPIVAVASSNPTNEAMRVAQGQRRSVHR